MIVSYNGRGFSGFQCQPNKVTVESALAKALSRLFGEPIKMTYSGRTDSGVHASNQVVCIKVNTKRELDEVINGGNCYLPEGIDILDVVLCDDSFHPRFNAKSRIYSYVFTSDRVPFYLKRFLVPVQFKPTLDCFNVFSDCVKGRHDFQHIRKKGSSEKTTIRRILNCGLQKNSIKDLYDFKKFITVYQIKIEADGFLYRMVRNLIGLYFDLEKQKLSFSDIKSLLGSNDKKVKINPVPAYGLSLVSVVY